MSAPDCLFLPLPLVLVAALVMPLPAQKPAIKSGPPANMQLTPVSVYAPTGPLKGKTFDAAKELGVGPGVLMFLHAVNRETAAMIRGLDTMGMEFGILGFKSFCISLGADRTSAEESAERISNALKMRNPIVVSTDGHEGPGNYALNRKAYLTVVVVDKGVVKESICITDTGPKDVPRLRGWIESVAGKLPKNGVELAKSQSDDPAKLKELIAKLYDQTKRQAEQLKRQQQQRQRGGRNNQRRRRGMERGRGRDMGPERGRGKTEKPASRPTGQLLGKIPDDPELQGLMRGLIGKFNTDEDVDDLVERVNKRVGNDGQLRQAAVQGFKRLLSTPYGTKYARKCFKDYVAKHDAAPKGKKKL